MRTYTKVPNKPKQSKRIGDQTLKCWFVRVIPIFWPNFERDIGGRRVVRKIHYGVACVVCACMCACMCVLCVRDMNIQRCRHAPQHTHIHILIQTLMYVEVWNIMLCNQNVPDPNKYERTPDVVSERPWQLSDSWEHVGTPISVQKKSKWTPSSPKPF